MKDYYKILKISSIAALDEIKHSYRILAHKYHPDKTQENQNSSELFLEIKEAYEILSDISKRSTYDKEYQSHFSTSKPFDHFKNKGANEINDDLDLLIAEMERFSPNRYDQIVLEELKESIDRSRNSLSKLKIVLGQQNDFYLKLSSLVVTNSIEISDRILNIVLQTLLITPSDNLMRFDNVARMIGALSWIESVLLNAINPIADLDMDTITKERFLLKFDFYNELKSKFESKTSKDNQSTGCYIATMIYGDYNHSNVLLLRTYRDHVLLKTPHGRIFTKIYYTISPFIVKNIKPNGFTHKVLKILTQRIVKNIRESKGI